jgi:hypothetical protein
MPAADFDLSSRLMHGRLEDIFLCQLIRICPTFVFPSALESCCLLLLVSAVFLVGCPDSGPKPPAMAKVSGTVNLDGKPMEDGKVTFSVPGLPGKTLDVTAGAFSGEVFAGTNHVTIVRENEERPHPMDPAQKMKVNTLDPIFAGGDSPFRPEIGASGATDLKFEVTSAK